MASNDILTVHLPEQSVEGKRLGRHVQHDPRLRDFQARRAPGDRQRSAPGHRAASQPGGPRVMHRKCPVRRARFRS
jgi:hypothetical protein